MSERKSELIKYLEVLMSLRNDGINCTDKINATLEELHKEMNISKYGVSNINNITIHADTKSEDISAVVKRIMKSFEEQARKTPRLAVWNENMDSSITATYDDGLKITGAKIELPKESTITNILNNPFDTII